MPGYMTTVSKREDQQNRAKYEKLGRKAGLIAEKGRKDF